MQEYCDFALDQPVVDLKLVAPISRELFVVEANSNLGQGACAAIHACSTRLADFRSLGNQSSSWGT